MSIYLSDLLSNICACPGDNETITYGPDLAGTGAYHIERPIFRERNYTIKSEISASIVGLQKLH